MKRRRLALALALSALLSGCALMPREEALRQAPVIHSQVEEHFDFIYVERGDVIRTAKVSCTYMPARSDTYAFGVGGERIDEIYVQVGDTVKEGQLLAQLDVTAYENALTDVERAQMRLKLQLAHTEEWRQVALSRAASQEEREKITEDYDLRRQNIDDQLYILSLRQSEYEAQLARRQIVSALDGTVTFVRNVPDDYLSATYDSLITVADSATSIFQANTEYHDMFVPGSPMTVTVGKDEYTATVVTAQELGIVKTGVSPKGKENVYLMLDEMNFDLEDGDRGSVTLILEQSLDTLKLPKGAVGRVNGETAVYYLDEDGVKRYKLVTTGVTNGPEIEILEGVTEGEAVIAN